jgi:hypothetical protein
VGRYSLNSNGGPNCDVRCSQRHASGRTGVPSGHEGATLWNDIGRICKRKEANLRKLRLELAPLAKPADDDTISRWRHSQVCGLLRIWDVHVSALCERGLVGRVVRSDLSVERGNARFLWRPCKNRSTRKISDGRDHAYQSPRREETQLELISARSSICSWSVSKKRTDTRSGEAR